MKYTSLTFLNNTGMHYCEGRWGLLGWIMCLSHVISWWVMWLLDESCDFLDESCDNMRTQLHSTHSRRQPHLHCVHSSQHQCRGGCKWEYVASLSSGMQHCPTRSAGYCCQNQTCRGRREPFLNHWATLLAHFLFCPCAHAQPHLLVLPPSQ